MGIPKGIKKRIKLVHFLTCNKNVPRTGQNLAKYPPKWKNRSRTPKIPPGKIEYKGQKLTYFKKQRIKGLFWPKKQAQILHLSRKMIDSTKNKLGMSLRTNKGLLWAKILINLEFKGQKNKP